MDNIEDFIHHHRDEFDMECPSEKVWQNIDKEIRPKKNKLWIAYSSVAAMVAIAFVVFIQNEVFILNTAENETLSPELIELQEAEAFYSAEVSQKLNEISIFFERYPSIQSDVEQDFLELDHAYAQLESDLQDGYHSQEVLEAMIQNNRIRIKMVDRMLEQLK